MWSTSFLILVFNFIKYFIIFCVVQFSRSVVSDSWRPHGLQHARPPCPSLNPGACSNSCPLSRWCHPTISSFLGPSLPAFNLSQHQALFKWVSSSHWVAKVLELQHQSYWFPLGLTDLISLQSRDSQESSPTPRVLENIFPSFFFDAALKNSFHWKTIHFGIKSRTDSFIFPCIWQFC